MVSSCEAVSLETLGMGPPRAGCSSSSDQPDDTGHGVLEIPAGCAVPWVCVVDETVIGQALRSTGYVVRAFRMTSAKS